MTRYLSTSAFIFFFLAVASTAFSPAQARPFTGDYTCKELRSLIARRGAIVMDTKPPHVFDRFVVHGGFCFAPEYAVSTSVPAKDGSCRVRHCKDDDRFRFLRRGD